MSSTFHVYIRENHDQFLKYFKVDTWSNTPLEQTNETDDQKVSLVIS